MVERVGVGLIGTGFMGRAHALAFRTAPLVFSGGPAVELALVADVDGAAARRTAEAFGFARWTQDWRALVADPAVDVVAITTPNFLHKEMALAALAAGKHVYCEKPLALSAEHARVMAQAAAAAGVVTLVGYNYLCSPATQLARTLIAEGAIGRVVHFRGTHNEDYMASADVPFSWRCEQAKAGSGTLGDMGSHIIGLALYLAGDITAVCADLQTVIPERRAADGTWHRVENDDQVHAMLRFAGGAIGTVESSRIAHGRKMGLAYEITGTEGSILFDQERMNELQVYTANAGLGATNGFRTVLMGPSHPDYGAFCPAPGHGLGYNDLKTVEVHRLLQAIAGRRAAYPDFQTGWQIETVLDAIMQSASERRWIDLVQNGSSALAS